MKTTASELQADLGQFYGTEGYTRYMNLHLTDGVKFLAETAGAWWLIDILCSYQAQCRKDSMLREMQFWKLTVKDGKGVVTCERDMGDVAITQEIEYTDFPLPEIKIWVEYGSVDGRNPAYVAMLPQER